MKYAEMQARIAQDRRVTSEALIADAGFAACEAALRAQFGPLTVDYVARPGAVEGEPVYLRGASLGELAKRGLLAPDGQRCFIERWDRECWGFGPTPAQRRERAELDRRDREQGRATKRTAEPPPTTAALPW